MRIPARTRRAHLSVSHLAREETYRGAAPRRRPGMIALPWHDRRSATRHGYFRTLGDWAKRFFGNLFTLQRLPATPAGLDDHHYYANDENHHEREVQIALNILARSMCQRPVNSLYGKHPCR